MRRHICHSLTIASENTEHEPSRSTECQLNSSYGENHLISFTFNSQSINIFDLSPFVSANPFVCWYTAPLCLFFCSHVRITRVIRHATLAALFSTFARTCSQQYLLRKHFPYNYPSSVTAFRFMLVQQQQQ